MNEDDFKNDVLRLANKFYSEHGKWPNELHLGSRWQGGYESIIAKSEFFHKADPLGKIKHWWYMGMRVFNEHWTHVVEWTEETETIKAELGLIQSSRVYSMKRMNENAQRLSDEYDEAQKEYQFWLKMEMLAPALADGVTNKLAQKIFTATENVERAFRMR